MIKTLVSGAWCEAMNDMDWSNSRFVCRKWFQFSQRSLENAPLPYSVARFVLGPIHPGDASTVIIESVSQRPQEMPHPVN